MVSGSEREQNDEKVDGRWRPSGEETQAFHHSSLSLRGLHPRPFLTATPAVPFLPRQLLKQKRARSLCHARRLSRWENDRQNGSLHCPFFESALAQLSREDISP